MGILSILGGGSKSKQQSTSASQSSGSSSSWNQAYPFLQDTFGQAASGSNRASNLLGSFLGYNGMEDREKSFDLWRSTPGYQFTMDEGVRAIGGNKAGLGTYLSGETLKALMKFGSGLADQTYNSYLDRLTGQQTMGFQLGQLLAGAGNRSQSQEESSSSSQSTGTSSQQGGIGGFLGGIIGGIAKSDRRLKKDITKLGELPNGLNVYQFWYTDNKGPYIGVMADEVEKIQPEALGPTIPGGYQTVNYGLIEGLDAFKLEVR